MKITGFDIFTFNLPFTQPFVVKGRPISKREGLIIRLTTEDVSVGFGEISPLPGFSKESFKEARWQVVDLRLKSTLFPSVQFGLETAVLNLLAAQRNKTSKTHHIPMIGLLEGSMENVISEARRMKKVGFQNFKLKVGGKNIVREIEKVHRIQNILKNQGTLCLDANRSWKFKEALRFGKALKKDSIEYIEEPFKNISTQLPRVTEFFKTTGIPVALDESLVAMNPKKFKPLKGLKAFILKPTILGGIEKTRCWIQRAKFLKIQTVISSSFESGVGLSMLAQLAVSFDSLPVGLDTYKYFSKDLLLEPFQMDRGSFVIPSWPLKENDLDFDLLKKI